MAWTTPRDWTGGEFVTEAIMDTHVRDNLLAVGPHLIVRKTSDQSVTSSTTLVNDTALLMAVTGTEVYQVQFSIIYTGVSSTGDLKVAFTFPAGGTIALAAIHPNTSGSVTYHEFTGTTTPTASKPLLAIGASSPFPLSIYGIYTNGGTGGNLQLQWAQNSSNATATIIKANSTLWAVKLA